MTFSQQVVTIALCILGTMLPRFLPFLIFWGKGPVPPFVHYLGQALPAAIFGMLIIYCLRNVDLMGQSHGLPEAIAIIVTAVLHRWKGQMLLSIAGGTICFMALVQTVF